MTLDADGPCSNPRFGPFLRLRQASRQVSSLGYEVDGMGLMRRQVGSTTNYVKS